MVMAIIRQSIPSCHGSVADDTVRRYNGVRKVTCVRNKEKEHP